MDIRKGPGIRGGGQSQPGATGRLFDCSIDADTVLVAMPLKYGGELGADRRPRGLYLLVTGGTATIRLEVGEPIGGNEAQRIFTLTGQGVWMEAGGWTIVKVYVDAVSSDAVRVGWTWTTIAPSLPPRLVLIQSIAAGVDTFIPDGAREIALSVADPSWVWTTNPGPGDLVINSAQPGAGQARDVNGARYTASLANVACWSLFPL